MSAFDDAVHHAMAHPAGSLADPLTDSLCDQANTLPAPLREGWENEPIQVPLRWWWVVLWLLVGCFLLPTVGYKPLQPRPLAASAAGTAAAATAPVLSAASGVQ